MTTTGAFLSLSSNAVPYQHVTETPRQVFNEVSGALSPDTLLTFHAAAAEPFEIHIRAGSIDLIGPANKYTG